MEIEKYYYKHINKVNEIVDRYDGKYYHMLSREDLFQAGMLGLMRAYHKEKKNNQINDTIEFEIVHEIQKTGYSMVMKPKFFRTMIQFLDIKLDVDNLDLSYKEKVTEICKRLNISDEREYYYLIKDISLYTSDYIDIANVTAAAVKSIHKILKCAFGVPLTWDLISTNPFLKVKPPKHTFEKREIWNSETIIKALKECEDPKLIIAIHLSFACSLRLGEILGLQWKNVHITDEDIKKDDAHIVVEQQLETVSVDAINTLDNKDVYFVFPNMTTRKSKTVTVLKKPKTNSSIRKIWLPETLAYILREWKKDQEEYKEYFQDEYNDYDLVVCFEDGRNCSHEAIRSSFNRLIEENDLPKVVFHSLRHSSTTYKLKLNHGDIKATQGDTGHAQADMITEVYGHIIDEDRKVNAQKFNETFYTESGNGVDYKKPEDVDVDKLVMALKSDPKLLNQLLTALK